MRQRTEIELRGTTAGVGSNTREMVAFTVMDESFFFPFLGALSLNYLSAYRRGSRWYAHFTFDVEKGILRNCMASSTQMLRGRSFECPALIPETHI
jgi:hypothetical protein